MKQENVQIVRDRLEEQLNQITMAKALLYRLMEDYIIGAWNDEKLRTQDSVMEEEVLFDILLDMLHSAEQYADKTVSLAFEE